MKITCISDLHGETPQLDGGDLLIVAGDLTDNDSVDSHCEFRDWLKNQTYSKKIVVAGNHDGHLQKMGKLAAEVLFKECGAIYLQDSGTEYQGLKIWGSPWTKTFPGMNPNCKAFTMTTEEDLNEKWGLIPNDVNMLITHCPPMGVMDKVKKYNSRGLWNPKTDGYRFAGSLSLSAQIGTLTNLNLHVFGHIHQGYGKIDPPKYLPNYFDVCKHYCVNASHVNEYYDPVNKPVYIEL